MNTLSMNLFSNGLSSFEEIDADNFEMRQMLDDMLAGYPEPSEPTATEEQAFLAMLSRDEIEDALSILN